MRNTQNQLDQTKADLKLVKPENIHLTLKFLGDVSENKLASVKEKLRETEKPEPFQAEVRGLGVFPNPNYIKVIWAGVGKNSEKIGYIKNQVEKKMKELNFSEEDREFTPHFTIARMKSGRGKNKINSIDENNSETEYGTIEVEKIKLKESELTPQGPIYSDIEKFSLR